MTVITYTQDSSSPRRSETIHTEAVRDAKQGSTHKVNTEINTSSYCPNSQVKKQVGKKVT